MVGNGVADELPAGLAYVGGSLHLGERVLTDQDDADEGTAHPPQQFEVHLAQVAPGEVVRLTFQARVTGQIPAATGAINSANISAENAEPRRTTDTVAVIDPFGTPWAILRSSSLFSRRYLEYVSMCRASSMTCVAA